MDVDALNAVMKARGIDPRAYRRDGVVRLELWNDDLGRISNL